ncbi:MAG TPA: hypothetical protein VID70_03895, partial [Solirubrobacteraceae bacterium]
MRPSLPHPLAERRHARRSSRVRQIGRARTPHRAAEPAVADPAVLRVREAGGPVDRACYGCECGYLFVAAVSTTVQCPH